MRVRRRARGATPPAGRRRRRGSRGAASVEYGLLIALIGASLCLGLGIAVKSVLKDTIDCFVAHMEGHDSMACPDPDPGGGDPAPNPGPVRPGVGVSPSPSPSPTTTPKPTVTPTPTP